MSSSSSSARNNTQMLKGKPELTASSSLSSSQRLVCFLFGFLGIAMFTMTTRYPGVIDTYAHSRGDIVAKLDDIITVPLWPKIETINGVDHYYLLPSKETMNNAHAKPKGILIVLHSCKRSGLEFFHLPEDRIIAYDALQKGLAVFAPTSQHRESGCFTQMDVSWVDQVVDEWSKIHHVSRLPRMGMAVSSGASFLFFVYQSLQLKSMAVYNTPQNFREQDLDMEFNNNDNDRENSNTGQAIPTAFVTMPSDETISQEMEANHNLLLQADIPAQIYRVTPHPFTLALCMARFPEMRPMDCQEIFNVIRNEFPQLLDNDGFVKESMKSGQWQQLFTKLDLDFNKRQDGTYFQTETANSGHSWIWAVIEQEVRTCQGFHAMTAEHHSSVLDFLMEQAGIDMPRTHQNDEESP